MNDSNISPSSPSNRPSELVGQILRARVRKSRFDHCDLDLLEDETDSVIAEGRLYQAYSLAWRNHRLLAELSEYQPNTILEKVFVRRLRREEGRSLWHVHERWGHHNPWLDLALEPDDIVTGTIIRDMTSTRSGEHMGYLAQLDRGAPIQTRESGMIEPCERMQPDIEVFLPDSELPWRDGALDQWSPNTKSKRFSLEVGDPIQALVLEIRVPPMNPVISVVRLIHLRDGTAKKTFKHRENLSRWYFWRFLGKKTEQHVDEADQAPEITLEHMSYAGRRLLLVDDNVRTMAAQSELLTAMGAEVHAIEVRPNHFPNAVTEVTFALRESKFDLALIDNNLPGRDLGQALIDRVRRQLGPEHPTRFALITADSTRAPTGDAKAKLRDNGAIGFVQRPLSHRALQQLLAGEEVWEDAKSPIVKQVSQDLPTLKASPTLQETLEIIAGQPGIHFAVLIKARRQIDSEDLIVAGPVPFSWNQYPEVLSKTALPLLINGRTSTLDVTAKEGGNELLRTARDGCAHWRILELGAARWIFGVGYGADQNIGDQFPLWHAALAAAVDAQGWRGWAQHVSGFVQLGLAHQGLSHEIIHLQTEFKNLLFILERQIGRLEAGEKLGEKNKDDLANRVAALVESNDELLEFSQRQLRAQALRHREVFLPEAAKIIQRIVDTECKEAEVTLHVTDPLLLALPLPNAALILPVVNLLLNAVKHHYRQENRRVELLFDIEETKTDQTLLIDVRDNGPGLGQSVLERLWQPGFSQAIELDKRHGIGLWLSRQLVEEAGGALELHENWRCVGACFRLRYPLHLG